MSTSYLRILLRAYQRYWAHVRLCRPAIPPAKRCRCACITHNPTPCNAIQVLGLLRPLHYMGLSQALYYKKFLSEVVLTPAPRPDPNAAVSCVIKRPSCSLRRGRCATVSLRAYSMRKRRPCVVCSAAGTDFAILVSGYFIHVDCRAMISALTLGSCIEVAR